MRARRCHDVGMPGGQDEATEDVLVLFSFSFCSSLCNMYVPISFVIDSFHLFLLSVLLFILTFL